MYFHNITHANVSNFFLTFYHIVSMAPQIGRCMIIVRTNSPMYKSRLSKNTIYVNMFTEQNSGGWTSILYEEQQ